MKSLLEVEWRTEPCNQPDCWCAIITTNEVDEDGEERYVVASGAIPKEYAEHIVKIHNEGLLQNS